MVTPHATSLAIRHLRLKRPFVHHMHNYYHASRYTFFIFSRHEYAELTIGHAIVFNLIYLYDSLEYIGWIMLYSRI